MVPSLFYKDNACPLHKSVDTALRRSPNKPYEVLTSLLFADLVTWDNAYSWTRAKTLRYVVELLVTDATSQQEVDAASAGGSWTRLAADLLITHF